MNGESLIDLFARVFYPPRVPVKRDRKRENVCSKSSGMIGREV